MRPLGLELSRTASSAGLSETSKADQLSDPSRAANRRSARQHGFTLVEVLVSLLVLSLGLLALAALQSQSVKSTHSAYLRSQATQYAYDIIDRMRANREAARAGGYDLTLADATPVCVATAPLADCDRAEWRADLANLPDGTGAIDYDPTTQQVTVLVQWNDERAGGTTTTTFTLQSQL